MDFQLSPSGDVSKTIVKEGLLYKRGETIRTWRARYFYLYEDGSLQGYRAKSKSDPDDGMYAGTSPIVNDFLIQDYAIMKLDRPKPFTFVIKVLGKGQVQRGVFERTFYVQSEEEREGWINAIEDVISRQLGGKRQGPPIVTVTMSKEIESYDPFSEKFGVQGTVYQNGRRRVTFENFELLKVIGKGTFGKVIMCRDKSSLRLYAMKILKKDFVLRTKEVDHTFTENRVLQSTRHPFLISLKCSFQTDDRLCFVTEYANGGELYFHLQKERIFTEERTRFYGAEITCAIGYLHRKGIVYRDIKLENLLLDKEGHVKIADFGLCKSNFTSQSTTETFCGTPEYLAPELLESGRYGFPVDWWALGVVMYEMMAGRLPFFNNDHSILYQLIINMEVEYPSHLSTWARDLLDGLLQKNPFHRLGSGLEDAKELMVHSFFHSINWTDLELRRIPPPFRPQVVSDTDTRYFDHLFTGASVDLTPPEQGLLSEIDFQGFSYKDLSGTLGVSVRSGPLHSPM